MVTGGKKVLVTQHVFEKLVAAKQAGHSSSHLVDLGSDGYIELGQIKQLYPDDATTNAETETWKAKKEARAEYARQHGLIQSAFRLQSPQDKAARMIRTFCLLVWTARGNKQAPGEQIEGALRDRLMYCLTSWFKENQGATHAPQSVYQKLIPYGERKGLKSAVPGVKSMADVIGSRNN